MSVISKSRSLSGYQRNVLIGPRLARTPLAPTHRLKRKRQRQQHRWEKVLRIRRALLNLLVVGPSAFVTWLFYSALPPPHAYVLDLALTTTFGLLFAWIAVWFWTGTAGFWVLLRKKERYAFAGQPELPPFEANNPDRVAIIMPAYEEGVGRICASMGALYRDLQSQANLERFDFYVLSDSATPDQWIKEEIACWDLVKQLKAEGRFFYRRRRSRTKKKSGNIADFCRRWGKLYQYMIVLDADSLLSAEAVTSLTAMMDANPEAGIIQSLPQVINQRSAYGRLQQFAASVYGRMFAAGLHYWHLGASLYWGHNAIIRVQPFMRHCMLPRLSRGWLGGDILSHDFVEAALMRRAGYEVWMAYKLEGSYEETPARFEDELARDRRWSRGNLQHLKLIGWRGIRGPHRTVFLAGALSYASSGIWLLFMGLGTAVMIYHTVIPPNYFPHAHSLYPRWPIWHRNLQAALISASFGALLTPKLLAALLAVLKKSKRLAFGGLTRLLSSVLFELLLSGLFAPARMLLHTQFVIGALFGWRVDWGAQQRDPRQTRWSDAFRRHLPGVVLAIVWMALASQISLALCLWLLPPLIGLVLVPFLEVFGSRYDLGEKLEERGLLVVPHERTSPNILLEWQAFLESMAGTHRLGFLDVIDNCRVHRIHADLLHKHDTRPNAVRCEREAIFYRVLRYGPESITTDERKIILYDQQLLDRMHRWRQRGDCLCTEEGRTG